MANKYVPQVDYTSRDYASIRDDMTALISDFTNGKWTNREPSDFGMTLLELFSYMGDILNYYIDRSANEAFIGTASQRDSVLQLSRLLGYNPTENVASTVTLTFYNSTGSTIVVPAKTQVSTSAVSNASSSYIIFETDTSVTVPAKVGATNGNAQVKASQGVTVNNEVIGTSNGQLNQTYKLSKTPVINNSVSIVVNDVNYRQVPYLVDYTGNDAVFSVYTNAEGISYVIFGDGVSGKIPNNGSLIYATYRVGGGTAGNISAGTIKTIITNSAPGLTVLNTYYGNANDDGSATGGTDAESTDSIRIHAPLSLRTLNRAVSLSDYASLAKAAGVAKAAAVADVYTSVTIFFVPQGDSGVENDGTTPSTVFNNTINTVKNYLVDKVPANTTVTFQPPLYVDVDLIAAVTVLPKFKQNLVQTQVDSTVASLFALDNVAFQDVIYLQDVYAAITSVPGVSRVQVNKLVRDDQDLSYTINNKELTSNVATLTTSVNHNLTIGQTVFISNVGTGAGDFDGTYVVTAVTSNTFSYANAYQNVSSTACSGKATVLVVKDIVCGANEIPRLNSSTLSLTYTGGI
jgi:Baseplate J-like protein